MTIAYFVVVLHVVALLLAIWFLLGGPAPALALSIILGILGRVADRYDRFGNA